MLPDSITLKNGSVIYLKGDRSLREQRIGSLSRNDVKELCYRLADLTKWTGYPSAKEFGQRFWLNELQAFAFAMTNGDTLFPVQESTKRDQQAKGSESKAIETDLIPDFTGESNQPELPIELGEYDQIDQSSQSESDVVSDLRNVLERIGINAKTDCLDAEAVGQIVESKLKEASESLVSLSESFNALLERTHKLETELAAVRENRAQRIEIVDSFGNVRLSDSLKHKSFDKLFAYVRAALATDKDGNAIAPQSARNIMLVGPAGAGKTFVCEQIAQALGIPFAFNGAIQDKFDVVGFCDANGNYTETEFYRLYCDHYEGGLYLWDELDGSSPNAALCLNAFLANGMGDFPKGKSGNGGIRKRSKRNVIVASCNVWNGATSDYVGRFQMDEAFKNRFGVRMRWDYDEKLESALAGDDKWTRFVQGCRANIVRHGIKKHIVSPRASETGAHLLRMGIAWETVVEDCVRCGLPDAQWNLVTKGLR